jgi:two-component system NarL family sensor kinase
MLYSPKVVSIVFEIILGIVLILIFVSLFVFSVLQSQKRKLANKLKINSLEKRKEILQAQSEVQNQILQQVGNELHDNIGQLLAVARIQVYSLEDMTNIEDVRKRAMETNETIEMAASSVREMSKSLDGSFVQDFGLLESITHILQRLNNTNKFKTTLTTLGSSYSLGPDREIILFRVVQEFISNTIKHAKADHIEVTIDYDSDGVILTITDNGTGFDYDQVMSQHLASSGSGLRNMQNRVALIDGIFELKTAPGSGTQLKIYIQP